MFNPFQNFFDSTMRLTMRLTVCSKQKIKLKNFVPLSHGWRHRKRTEEKAKVVASVWGEELIKSLAALAACFAKYDFE